MKIIFTTFLQIELGVVVDSDDNAPVENSRTSGRSKAKGKKKNGASEICFCLFGLRFQFCRLGAASFEWGMLNNIFL